MRIGVAMATAVFTLAAASPTATHAASPMNDASEAQRNLTVVTKLLEAMANGDVAASQTLIADDFVNHGRRAGGDGLQRVFQDLRRTYTDGRSIPLDIAAVGEHVMLRTYVSQRHVGTPQLPIDGGYLSSVAPTNRLFSIQHIHWWKVRNGVVYEHWAHRDDVSMMVQLGLWPAPPGFPGPMPEPAAAAPHVAVQDGQSPQQTANLATIRAYVDAVNRGAVAAEQDLFDTFPDTHLEAVEVAAAGDDVVVRTLFTGTHRGISRTPIFGGVLLGKTPTGKHVSVGQLHWFRLRDGTITEHFVNRDDITMLVQLGIQSPPPPSPFAPVSVPKGSDPSGTP